MIFISHNSKDKPIVEPIAIRLKEYFGQKNVFYDSWSIKPGEGIVNMMNEGLQNCKYFFFFVSKNSLESYMVKLEWQNAIMRASKGKTILVPVRIDNCEMPALLAQTLYIDIYRNGIEAGIRQIVDLVSSNNTFNVKYTSVKNISAKFLTKTSKEVEIEILANYFMEPIVQYIFATTNRKDEISYTCKNCNITESNFLEGIVSNANGQKLNGILLKFPDVLVPSFSQVARFEALKENPISISGIFHEKKQSDWEPLPLI
jgi:hypothetical protein